jgi:hypothetical protein
VLGVLGSRIAPIAQLYIPQFYTVLSADLFSSLGIGGRIIGCHLA